MYHTTKPQANTNTTLAARLAPTMVPRGMASAVSTTTGGSATRHKNIYKGNDLAVIYGAENYKIRMKTDLRLCSHFVPEYTFIFSKTKARIRAQSRTPGAVLYSGTKLLKWAPVHLCMHFSSVPGHFSQKSLLNSHNFVLRLSVTLVFQVWLPTDLNGPRITECVYTRFFIQSKLS